MDVLEAIEKRRSIKPEQMKTDPVPPPLMGKLLEAANWAPSHGMTEPWRFVVFTGAARGELAEAMMETMREDGDVPLGKDDPRRKKIADKCATAPVIIAIVCAPSTEKANVVEHEEIASTAMAVQNMHLVARSLGLGAFWSSGKKAFHPKMARFLSLEPPSRCLGFLFVGWPAVPWPEGIRRPIADKVRWRS